MCQASDRQSCRRFPGDAQIAPPSDNTNLASQSGPTAENPGNVHPAVDPKSDPNPPKQEGRSIFNSIENPYALREAMTKLESSLDEIISLFQGEGDTLGKDGGFTKGKEA